MACDPSAQCCDDDDCKDVKKGETLIGNNGKFSYIGVDTDNLELACGQGEKGLQGWLDIHKQNSEPASCARPLARFTDPSSKCTSAFNMLTNTCTTGPTPFKEFGIKQENFHTLQDVFETSPSFNPCEKNKEKPCFVDLDSSSGPCDGWKSVDLYKNLGEKTG